MNGNGAKLPALLSVRHKAQVCRDDASRDGLLLSCSFYGNVNVQPELSEIPMRMRKSDSVEGLFCCTKNFIEWLTTIEQLEVAKCG